MAGEQPTETGLTRTRIDESGLEFTPQVEQVLELFAPQIDRLVANVVEAEQGEVAAQAAFEEANDELNRAKKAKAMKMQAHRLAESLTHRSRGWLADQRESALSALASTGGSRNETFVAQTIIEGRPAAEAKTALETLAKLVKKEGGEQVYKRLLVLGSFPVLRGVERDPELIEKPANISFVDVAEVLTPISLERVSGRHYLIIDPDKVSQFRMAHNILGGTQDTSGAERVLQAEPLDLRVVTTQAEFEDLTDGKTWRGLYELHSNLDISSRGQDFLPPTVIAGEAVAHFTTWLAGNPYMRPMLFAVNMTEQGLADQALALEAESLPLEDARKHFKERFEHHLGFLVNDFHQMPRENDAIEAMRADLLFSREVQEYLGINDAELIELIEAKLERHVEVRGRSAYHSGPISVEVISTAKYVETVDELCDYIQECFERGGYKLYSAAMKETAKNVQLNVLRKAHNSQGNDRASRKRRQLIADFMEQVRASYDQQLQSS